MPHPGDLRERLLEQAILLLDEGGVDAVTVRAVARRADVSHGAPRRHFASRAQLLAAMAQAGLDALDHELAAADERQDAGARLRAAALAYLGFARQRPALFELLTRHDLLEHSGAELRHTSLSVLAHWHELVAAAVPGATQDDSLVLFTAVHGLAGLHSRRALDVLRPDAVSLLDDILARATRPAEPA